jgi:hypothetical protein
MPIALAALSPAVIGILALTVLLAAIILVEVMDRAAHSDAVPGFVRGALSLFVRAIHAAVNALTDWLASIATVGLSVLVAPARAFVNLADAIDEALFNLASVIRVVWRITIPYLTGLIIDKANQLSAQFTGLAYNLYSQALGAVSTVGNYLRGLIAATDASLRAGLNSLSSAVSSALARATTFLESLIETTRTALLATVTATAASLLARIASLRTELTDLTARTGQWAVATALGIAIPTAQRYTDAIIGAYRGALDMVAGAGLARVWDGILADVDSLAHAFPGSLADVLPRIGAIPRVRVGDIASVLSIATAIGAISLDWINRCGKGLCQNLGGFGNELAALGDAAMMLEIVALITDAMADPDGAATHVHDTITNDLTAVGNNFTSILTGG